MEEQFSSIEPSQEQMDRLLLHYQSGRMKEFEDLAVYLTKIFPKHQMGWKALGVAFKQTGRLSEAIGPIKQSIELRPEDPENHNNLGITLQELGNFNEAQACFREAIALKPDFAEAHNSLASVLKDLDKLEESAECSRRAVAIKPDYAEAHYNCGVALEALGRLDEAETSYQRAIVLDPEFAQAHLRLSNTLSALHRTNEAEASCRKAIALRPDFADAHFKLAGILEVSERFGEARECYLQVIALKPNFSEAYNNLGVSLTKLGRQDEAEAHFRRALAMDSDLARAHFNLGFILKEQDRLYEAEASYRQALSLTPEDFLVHVNLGLIMQELGRLEEAEAHCRKAIDLNPEYAEAHNNLGAILNEQGRPEKALASYRNAVALQPDYAEAFYNLGATLKTLGNLAEAEASYAEAVKLNPGFAEAHNNLGNVLKSLGRLEEAISSYVFAINLRDDYSDAYINLGAALTRVRFEAANRRLYPILAKLLTEGDFVRPMHVQPAILSLIRLDDAIEGLLREPEHLFEIAEADQAIKRLADLPLLHHLLRTCPLSDLQLEEGLVSLRRSLLVNLDRAETSTQIVHFLSTLALQCFINEYAFYETDDEVKLVRSLEQAIAERLAKTLQPSITDVLCLATYRPLLQYDWFDQLTVLDHIPEVTRRLIDEPLAERLIKQDIPSLTTVDDDISNKVKEQYEESPYPRWVKLALPSGARSIAEICQLFKLRLHSEDILEVLAPSVLVAGCGTGQHSIETASSFACCTVLAVDLSLSSLAYAQRKTNELEINNIQYGQADILKLDQLGQTFDIIECAGTLHHMESPMAGWRVLADLLNIGGLMKVGLYSEAARSAIVKIREEIAVKGLGTSEDEIRQFRKFLSQSSVEHHRKISRSGESSSLSTLRDLIFHVQEHRFTLPQISSCLDELGLEFCGFEDSAIVTDFEDFFGPGADACDLSLWHQFEESRPSTFGAMYQFWCQKVEP